MSLISGPETENFDEFAKRYVFLSYCQKDEKIVLPLANALRREGIALWIDRERIPLGSQLKERMAEGVIHSKAVIICYSTDYCASRSCKQEANLADEEQKPIFPVCCESDFIAEPWLKIILGNSFYADLTRFDCETVAGRLSEHLKAHAVPDVEAKPRGKSSNPLVEGERLSRLKCWNIMNDFKYSFTLKPSNEVLAKDPRGITIVRDRLFAVTDSKSDRVHFYDENGLYERTEALPMPRQKVVGNVGVDTYRGIDYRARDDILVLSDISSNKIIVADGDLKFRHQFGQQGFGGAQFYKPFGVAIHPHRDIIFVAERWNHRWQSVTFEGESVVNQGKESCKDGFKKPSGIAVSHDGRFVAISDTNNHRIQLFSADGEFLLLISREGSKDGLLSYPTGLTFDSDDNIVVVDSGNNRIQAFKRDGSHLLTFGDKKLLSYPRDVCYHNRSMGVAEKTNGGILICKS